MNAYVFYNDAKVNCGEVLQTHAPTAMRIINRLTKLVDDADKIDVAVTEALAGQFAPF